MEMKPKLLHGIVHGLSNLKIELNKYMCCVFKSEALTALCSYM